MLLPLILAAAAATTPPGLGIDGVTVDRGMPANASHVEAPPFRAYKTQAAPVATPSLQPAAEAASKRR